MLLLVPKQKFRNTLLNLTLVLQYKQFFRGHISFIFGRFEGGNFPLSPSVSAFASGIEQNRIVRMRWMVCGISHAWLPPFNRPKLTLE